MPDLDFRPLEALVVRRFTDSPHVGEDWMRMRQGGPSVTGESGRLTTPPPALQPFRAFVDPGSGKQTAKDKGGDKQDETITLYVCQLQQQNGLNVEVDFKAPDAAGRTRADWLRRELDGKRYEITAARWWKAGRFWALDIRQVQGVQGG